MMCMMYVVCGMCDMRVICGVCYMYVVVFVWCAECVICTRRVVWGNVCVVWRMRH